MSNRLPGSSKNSFPPIRSYIIRNIRELNLFSDNPFWSSTLNHSEQILSTRLFIIFVLISLLVVITYTSLIIRTHSNTLEHFSLSDFERHHEDYPTTINVPCTQVSNPYHKFLRLSPKFHPICSSPFIGDEWISSLFVPNVTYHNVLDSRTFTFAQFQALGLLCHTAYQSVKDGYRTFNSTHLVTGAVLTRAEFYEIFDVLTSNFRNNLVENENRTAKTVSLSIAQNGFMSALRTNFYVQSKYPRSSFSIYSEIYLKKNEKSSCDCRLQENQCTYPAYAVYNWTESELDKSTESIPPSRFQVNKFKSNHVTHNSTQVFHW